MPTFDVSQRVAASAVYTMRELNQHTARVLDEINASGEPAAITKHGRFVAMITPLEHAEIEAIVLNDAPTTQDLHRRATSGRDRLSPDEVLKRISDHHYGDRPQT